jgi:hypothetical protein
VDNDMKTFLIRWPLNGEHVQHEVTSIVPRQSDVLCVEGTWVRVSNVMIHPQLIVYSHRLAVEDDEQRALEIQFGLPRREVSP